MPLRPMMVKGVLVNELVRGGDTMKRAAAIMPSWTSDAAHRDCAHPKPEP